MLTRLVRPIVALVPLAIALHAPAQPLVTYAGGGTDDGKKATDVSFQNPLNITVDAAGNIYVVDQAASRVRKVDAATGLISTVAGNGRQGFGGDEGPANRATLNNPTGVAIDASGNLYVADAFNGR